MAAPTWTPCRQVDDQVVDLQPEKRFRVHDVHPDRVRQRPELSGPRAAGDVDPSDGSDGFGIYPHRFRRNAVASGRYWTITARANRLPAATSTPGDQVFVDKFTYNFRHPRRGDVFVFSTRGISGIPMDDPNVKSQFYIKRLAGVPNDQLRDRPAAAFHQRSAGAGTRFRAGDVGEEWLPRLYKHAGVSSFADADDVLPFRRTSYFALGDNSYNSSDSRNWGVVPADNVVGRGLFVYWPFTRHWGLIH